MNLIAIHSNKMMAYLVLRRFCVIRMEPNKKYPDKKVFIFNDSPQIRGAMNDFKSDIIFQNLSAEIEKGVNRHVKSTEDSYSAANGRK